MGTCWGIVDGSRERKNSNSHASPSREPLVAMQKFLLQKIFDFYNGTWLQFPEGRSQESAWNMISAHLTFSDPDAIHTILSKTGEVGCNLSCLVSVPIFFQKDN